MSEKRHEGVALSLLDGHVRSRQLEIEGEGVEGGQGGPFFFSLYVLPLFFFSPSLHAKRATPILVQFVRAACRHEHSRGPQIS